MNPFAIFTTVALVLSSVFLFMRQFLIHPPNNHASTAVEASMSVTEDYDGDSVDCMPYSEITNKSTERTRFGGLHCHTTAYPSDGGFIFGAFTGVELDWLGLSRFEQEKRSSTPEDEDRFAFKMLQLGAKWWQSRSRYLHSGSSWTTIPYPDLVPPATRVGYPSAGGVWVLNIYDGEPEPEDYARVLMARDMDERSRVLKEMGASFYANVSDCPDIPKSLGEGIAQGRCFEKKMKNKPHAEYENLELA